MTSIRVLKENRRVWFVKRQWSHHPHVHDNRRAIEKDERKRKESEKVIIQKRRGAALPAFVLLTIRSFKDGARFQQPMTFCFCSTLFTCSMS